MIAEKVGADRFIFMEIAIYLTLGFTSVVGLAFIVERALALRWGRVVPSRITDALAAFKPRSDLKGLRRVCEQRPSPLGRLVLLAVDHLDWPKEENVDALQTAARHEIVRLERGLVVLEVIVGIAPLLGLVGTIAGMMSVFNDLGQTDLNNATKLAQGIALILRATLAGLLIAIPSLVAWSYFSKKVEVFAVEMEALCDEFIRKVYRDANPAVPDAKATAAPVSASAPAPK